MVTPTHHDENKVLLGTVGSSDREITNEIGDPATFPAGLAVRRKADETLSLDSADGQLIGVSLGKSLSDDRRTAVCRVGNFVPIQLAMGLDKGDLTFVSKIGTPLAIEFLDTGTAGAETVDYADGLISVSMEDGVSTATQIKTALDAEVGDVIETTIAAGQGAVAQAAFAEDAIDETDQPILGAPVRISDDTGKAVVAGGTVTGATFISGAKTGVTEDGSTVAVALIDMGGGL